MKGLRYLRPPGAKPEQQFLAKCIQCGQCAQICPYRSIKLQTGFNLFVSGTPQIFPRQIPCYLCMRCSPVCPSGALEEVSIYDVRIGKARLDKKSCYTWSNTVICRSCFENCPVKGTAIELERGIYPVITDQCTGCGICEYVCPVKAIVTIPSRFLSSKNASLSGVISKALLR